MTPSLPLFSTSDLLYWLNWVCFNKTTVSFLIFISLSCMWSMMTKLFSAKPCHMDEPLGSPCRLLPPLFTSWSNEQLTGDFTTREAFVCLCTEKQRHVSCDISMTLTWISRFKRQSAESTDVFLSSETMLSRSSNRPS